MKGDTKHCALNCLQEKVEKEDKPKEVEKTEKKVSLIRSFRDLSKFFYDCRKLPVFYTRQ